MPDMQGLGNSVNTLAAIGLALGGVFGLAGIVATQPNMQAMAWIIDGCGLVMASALLTLKFHKMGSEIVSAGFLVFGIGEGVIISSTAAGATASVPSFGAGVALWATALLLISLPRQFPLWVRLVGVIAAALFFVTPLISFLGQQLVPTASPLPFFAYLLLVITFVGWILALLSERPS